ncbi:E3 UFM1-protein ligase 1 [Syngnathoides biaculeatus]|uniref:E3 UFM1-protein ligase 1 n=1 Tax=Syngnathoides biaculeatus TaxID=300417 RepID=UPI002ADD9FB7|nr:E3 UFM1-protein ligase 1 [Syngnathoides biaculeatus]XP_061684653.1 E3 UFM1-protein ligase 1 [Syngnathoides biaculeatus]XP_061684654.1 E3 UFM1-protein ligase 1 [Syngnathoides biaculeatus]XP_061684655.1 E3 UFM1-protein ligase 1 [Syngnathoides biaculeatus]XP_061684656.1 E3 UFM1-protein ligase 1 [Syngnathoides biaculeatus]
MASEWEEIRRLAADFQRAQFADTAQRLSERDCIEIISKLVREKKLDVVHTLDGKEYITPAQISKEIRDELYRHGGRVNILDLQQIINVDWFDVENRANDIAKSDKSVQLVLGQLINDTYLHRLAEEVNETLQEAGLISIAELCKSYDLPGDFLNDELSKRLGKVIQGELDQSSQGVIFTPGFVGRHTAKIRGLFSAVTRPTPVAGMIGAFGLHEHLLYTILEELVSSGRLRGTVVGGRQDNTVYIPDIYSKTQNTWVDSSLRQNGYLEFDSLIRLGIPEPKSYIKKRFKSSKLLFLSTACASQALIDQVEACVEEAVSSATWIDVQAILPSCLSEEDMGMLINQAMRNTNVQSTARVLGGTVVVSEKWIGECLALFDDSIQQKARNEFKSNPVLLLTEEDLKQASAVAENSGMSRKDKREAERKKKGTEGSGTVKGGGGGNAREIRIRKTKKKGRKDDDDGYDEEETKPRYKKEEAAFMTREEIVAVLEAKVSDGPQEIFPELAEHFERPLSKAYQEALQSLFLSTTCSLSAANKKSVKNLQEELTNLYNNIRLFEKGTRFFSDETQVVIAKHVLKTVGTDVTNILVNFLAADLMMSVENPAAITPEVRSKILAKVSNETKVPLVKLHNSLNGKTIEEFLENFERSAEACGFMLKKADKKKEREAFLLHRQTLTEQLNETEDPALVLHLTSVLLFQDSTHCILHAPGRCVPNIIGTLTGRIPQEKQELLSAYQSLVVKQLTSHIQGRKRDEDEELSGILAQFKLLTPQVKELALSQRKTSTSEAHA